MESMVFNFPTEEPKISMSNENTASTAAVPPGASSQPARAEPFAALHGRTASELLEYLEKHEPRAGDTAPPTTELDEMMLNFRINGSELAFEETESSQNNFFMGSRAADSVTSSRGTETDQMSTFDFLVKSVSAANNYVSMLTREQLSVLQALRPGLLYEFLQEVVRVRTERRMRRALPNECAFCKNNGENEECYSSHALKDWRGRVLCPVLRAFRCPRCGATGDRAHTIKYCQDNQDTAADRQSLPVRRRMPPPSLLLGNSAPSGQSSPHTPHTPHGAAPPPSPSAGGPLSHGLWSSFGLN